MKVKPQPEVLKSLDMPPECVKTPEKGISQQGITLKPKQKSKWQRWVYAVKNPKIETMLISKRNGQIGVVAGMFCAIIWLTYMRVWWLIFFLPFIWFIQLIDLISTINQLRQLRKAQAQMKELMKGGNKDG